MNRSISVILVPVVLALGALTWAQSLEPLPAASARSSAAGISTSPSSLGLIAGPGTAYCFGVNCPCGNDDPSAGCVNSSGVGALLSGLGTSSVAAGDLGLSLTGLPKTSVTLILLSNQQGEKPFKDGKLCLGGTIWRLWKHFNSGQAGAIQIPAVANLFTIGGPHIAFAAGDAWNFQSWYRDPPATTTACGQKANLTNGYAVTFLP